MTSGDDLPVPRPVRWSDDGRAVELLDQTLLPAETRYLRLESAGEVAEAIRTLKVRGAPAIGIAGAMGLALGIGREVRRTAREGEEPSEDRIEGLRRELDETRPTGRNLSWALERVIRAYRDGAAEGAEAGARAARDEADAIAAEDRAMCARIAEAGLALLPPAGEGVLTHCNAGALATGGLGTALAPLYRAHSEGRGVRVFASETRPVLQGARLTAWELSRAGVDATVVTDLATGALMREGAVRMVIVGADRIAANGDTANKIGTYALAVLAHHHGLPFYVAAPRSTFDPALASGAEIEVEERDPDEVRGMAGRETAAPDAAVLNPAFDVTPAELITAFVTDGGVLRPPFGPAVRRLCGEEGRETADRMQVAAGPGEPGEAP